MNRRNHSIAIVAAVLIGLVVPGYGSDNSQPSAAPTEAPSDAAVAVPPLITTAPPARRNFTHRIPWIGAVEARASVELMTRVAGCVVAIDAADQGRLEQGRRIMRLGGPQIAEARAKLAAEIDSLQNQADLARRTVDRLKASLKSQLATKDQLAAAQETRLRLDTQLKKAQLDGNILENQTVITAPMNGVFTNRRVSVGQDVNAGQIVGSIIDTGRLRIAASVFPPEGIDLIGKEAFVRLGAGHTVKGIVRHILPQASAAGALTVWIEGPRIDTQFHPGERLGGHIVTNVKSDALAVPDSAIVYDAEEHPYLFVRIDSTYEQVRVRLGMEQDGWVEILSDLKPDQSVVTHGAYELFHRTFNEQYKVVD